MAIAVNRLSALQVDRLKKAGYYPDGAGLYLCIKPSGAKSWIYRYRFGAREREMGLGPLHTFSLAEAREQARKWRQVKADGRDPIEERDAERHQRRLADGNNISFDAAAAAYIKANAPAWSNPKHVDQWRNTIATYASPVIGAMPVVQIDTAHVLRVLEPIWLTKNETASRLRGRIEKVLDWAKVHKYRTGDNPAAWKAHLSKVLPAPSKVQPEEHHAALPWQQMPALMARLKEQPGVGALVVQFIILTATRTSEALNAKWSEFDLDTGVWTIPKERMKAKREHRVPLSAEALDILTQMQADSAPSADRPYVFPGRTGKKPLSNMVGLVLLRRMKRQDLTVHGFRSTFKDWAREATSYPDAVSEAALAHIAGDKTFEAYARGDLMEKRRALMADWAKYCSTPKTPAEVVPIRAAKAA